MFLDRDYQTKSEGEIFKAFETQQSTLLVLATGLGKTICFARIIKKFQPLRALVLADTDELIKQAVDKITRVTGLMVEIEKADLYATTHQFSRAPVVVSSIQTQISGPEMNRRYMRFDPKSFGLLVCDEAHLCAAPGWREVIAYYTARNPALKLLGVTATPDRADKKSLVPEIFQSVAYEYNIEEAKNDGWLVDITQRFVNVASLDISHIETKMGDLNQGQLSKVMEMEENIQNICQPSLEAIWSLEPGTLSKINPSEWRAYLKTLTVKPRRTIVFTVSVEQAEMCAAVFGRAMDGVEWVCGKTSKEERPEILDRFMKGQTHVICNAMILSKGYDNPWVELICQARPTKSRTVYAQQIGRGTRTLPGVIDDIPTKEKRLEAISKSEKPILRVLDFVGNSGKHKLVSCYDFMGKGSSDEARELAKKVNLESGTFKRVMVTLSNAQIELEKRRREAAEKARRQEQLRKSHLLAKANYITEEVNPYSHDGKVIPFTSKVSRDGRAFSDKQCKVLRIAGCDPAKVAYRQGQAIIAKQIAQWELKRQQKSVA